MYFIKNKLPSFICHLRLVYIPTADISYVLRTKQAFTLTMCSSGHDGCVSYS